MTEMFDKLYYDIETFFKIWREKSKNLKMIRDLHHHAKRKTVHCINKNISDFDVDDEILMEAVNKFLNNYEFEGKDGIFVSSLVNKLNGKYKTLERFGLSGNVLEIPDMGTVSHLGYKNNKILKVEGSLGDMPGSFMDKNGILIGETAGKYVGGWCSKGAIYLSEEPRSIFDLKSDDCNIYIDSEKYTDYSEIA